MFGVVSVSTFVSPHLSTASRLIVKMSATGTRNPGVSIQSVAVKPPSHPTYDLKGVIKLALAEDAGDRGDVTCMATIPADMEAEAHFLAKENGVIAGIALAEMIFGEVDPTLKVEWSRKDGDCVQKGLQFGKVHGRAHNIVVSERVVLNFMQRMSGIATLTKAMADAARPAYILETRKTAPGLRLVDKWAVLIGGGQNHRMGLFDMVMIKDNHISVAGGVKDALRSVDLYLEQNNLHMGVEVETRTLEEVNEALHYASQTKTSLTRIMLDNMVVPLPNGDVDVSMLKEAVDLINGRFDTEASGNVTLETVHKIGQTGVTYISREVKETKRREATKRAEARERERRETKTIDEQISSIPSGSIDQLSSSITYQVRSETKTIDVFIRFHQRRRRRRSINYQRRTDTFCEST